MSLNTTVSDAMRAELKEVTGRLLVEWPHAAALRVLLGKQPKERDAGAVLRACRAAIDGATVDELPYLLAALATRVQGMKLAPQLRRSRRSSRELAALFNGMQESIAGAMRGEVQ